MIKANAYTCLDPDCDAFDLPITHQRQVHEHFWPRIGDQQLGEHVGNHLDQERKQGAWRLLQLAAIR